MDAASLIAELEDQYAILGLEAPEEAVDWTLAQIREYFESDGEVIPAAGQDSPPATTAMTAGSDAGNAEDTGGAHDDAQQDLDTAAPLNGISHPAAIDSAKPSPGRAGMKMRSGFLLGSAGKTKATVTPTTGGIGIKSHPDEPPNPCATTSDSEKSLVQSFCQIQVKRAAASMRASALCPNTMTLQQMRLARVLDWTPGNCQLTPVATPMDGNCLLHAVSLALWGSADTEFMLRTALLNVLEHNGSRRLFAQAWVEYMCRRDAEEALTQVRA